MGVSLEAFNLMHVILPWFVAIKAANVAVVKNREIVFMFRNQFSPPITITPEVGQDGDCRVQ